MKKEVAAAALLIALIAASLFNIHWLDGFIGEFNDDLENSRSRMETGDFDGAEAYLREAIDEWMGADGYTHIFIRHSEIDSTTDAFYELLSDVVSQDTESAIGSYEKLTAHLSSIIGMERPTFGSIF